MAFYITKEFLTVEEKGFFDEARMKVYVGEEMVTVV